MSRFDNIGLFWQDHPEERGSRADRIYIQPDIPETGWRPPTEFPNLSAATALSFDVETYDPDLTTHGPGWARNNGHIVGVALGAQDNAGNLGQWYFPIRHTIEPEHNMDANGVTAFLSHTLNDMRPKVGANLYYDLGWCRQEGVQVKGPLYDVQYAEALLNSEAPNVALEVLAQKYLKEGKDSPILYQWLADFYGGPVSGKQRANIYRAPPRLVGPYAESDANLPLRVIAKQWQRLNEWGLLPLFHMECKLIPLLVAMRFKGVQIDIAYAERFRDELVTDIAKLDEQIKQTVGFEVNTAASASLAKAFDTLGLSYPRTAPTKNAPHGNPSFKAEFLDDHDDPFAQLIVDRRRHEKIRGTFIESYLLGSHVNNRVHCQFNPLKGDGYGARSGRFSSSTPNLQNIPTRTELGKRVRRCFIAEGRWRKFDYSQIEYRLLAHHAIGNGSNDIRRKYRNDPTTDYHVATQIMVHELTGLDIPRPRIKNINFGFIYGMSQKKLMTYLGLAPETAKELFTSYHNAVPFARETMHHYMDEVQAQGWVATFAGRRSQFPKFVPNRFDMYADPLEFEDAVMEYGQIKRAFSHKALNRVLQGGAADIMKRAMVKCYEDGIFDLTGIPLLTVHDELDFDDIGAPAEAWAEMAHIMETCAPELSVPIMVEQEVGPNWGQVQAPQKQG